MGLFKRLISFAFVAICVLSGVGSLAGGMHFVALAYFVAAAFFWPAVAHKVGQTTGKGWVSPVSGVVLMFLVAPMLMLAAYPSGEKEIPDKPEQVALKETIEEQPEGQIERDDSSSVQSRIQAQHEKYMGRVNNALVSVREFAIPNEADGMIGIVASLTVIESWSRTYEAGEVWVVGDQFDLSQTDQAKRQELRRVASKKQVDSLPKIRDLYGPVMRRELWEADASARTFGAGFKTIEFVSFEFARNKNIKETMQELREPLMSLRFNQARFKWSKHDSKYTFYNLDSPKDGQLVRWRGGGEHIVLE